MTIKSLLSNSPEETRLLGRRLAGMLLSGDVILLSGDLGAGKSELARGIAQGLGAMGPITSPTFTLLNEYDLPGGMKLKHFDWYRIEDPEELLLAGLDELIGGEGITLIEWHERAAELVPENHLAIRIMPLQGESRQLAFLPSPGFHALDWAKLSMEHQP